MSDRLVVFLEIVLIGVASTPVSLVMADLSVPDWALFSGHICMWVAGIICAEIGRRTNP